MTESFKQQLRELIDQAAERSVDRNMLELRDADARVRQFKQGCEFLMPVLMKAITQRNGQIYAKAGEHIPISVKLDKDLLNILKEKI